MQDFLYSTLEEPNKSKLGYWINVFIYFLIIVSIFALMFASVEEYKQRYKSVFTCITNSVMILFIIEYILRVYASGKVEKHKGFIGKLRYMVTPYAIIDFLAIAPFLFIGLGINTSFIRSLRLLRVFRLFRIKKYASFIKTMREIVVSKKEEFLVLLLFTVLILVFLSFIVFEVEHNAQPKVFTNLFQTFWWAVATLTTVGYGDMYPITTAGKIVTASISIIGIAFVAIPGGIFASEFIAHVAKKENKCPICNSKDINVKNNPIITIDENVQIHEALCRCEKCDFMWVRK